MRQHHDNEALPRRSLTNSNNRHRNNNDYYYTITSDDEGKKQPLGRPNFTAALGNPLKGLMGSPWFGGPHHLNSTVPSSLEWFYIGLNQIMVNDPDISYDAAFNWTELEARLVQTASRHKHTVFTVVVHYPGWEAGGLAIPQYLYDKGLQLHPIEEINGSNQSPDYADPILLQALEQFITALGAKYDGDPRIGFIHLGLLGFWGEWHTYPHNYVPLSSWESVTEWYKDAFSTTKMHVRYPFQPAYDAGMGLSDGSFTTATYPAGGEDYHFYFVTDVNKANMSDFWRRGPMAGETRNENQGLVFKDDYVPGYGKQDFGLCVNMTHASYMLHNHAFDHMYEGAELRNALRAHAGMGYNFMVHSVSVAEWTNSKRNTSTIEMDVTVAQIGVAPFYYPLSLILDCPSADTFALPQTQDGVEGIIAEGDTQVFSFRGLPATEACLNHMTLRLDSPYAYKERPIKFAQGVNGSVILNIPTPNQAAAYQADDSTDETMSSSKRTLVISFVVLLWVVCLGILCAVMFARFRNKRRRMTFRRKSSVKNPREASTSHNHSTSNHSSTNSSGGSGSPTKDDKSNASTAYSSFFPNSPPKFFEPVPE